MKTYLILLFIILSIPCQSQDQPETLKAKKIQKDLVYLDKILQNKSSYQGLNGYNYKKDFQDYIEKVKTQPVTKYEFELFLSKVIGKLGDRHSSIKGDRVRNSLFFPIAFAPYKDKVAVINYDKSTREYAFFKADFPYLTAVNNIPIDQFLPKILPEEASAPKNAYATRAIRELRDIEVIFKSLGMELPNPISLTLANEEGVSKETTVDLVSKKQRARYWDERLYRKIYFIEDEKYSDSTYIQRFFKLIDGVAYIQLVDMLDKEESPIFFHYLNHFMTKAQDSKGLIIDVRDNGGGTRHLIQELAGYLIHPDSIYVVNAAKQRGKTPLNNGFKERLHGRYLFSKNELDTREQAAVDQFMNTFKPMHELDQEKFSDYHYYVLNGQKLTQSKFHYNKPIYILANERSFSAASILVSVFKGLPNVTIVGVNTDGSSGNSQRFELPHSGLRGKISTMVSFQKDGQLLDGTGTKPDIVIERNLDQIFWKEDYQLNKTIELINTK